MYPEEVLQLYAEELANRSLGTVVVESLVCGFLILAAFFGNMMVLWIIYRYRNLRTIPNFFVLSLALSDVIMSGFCAPMCLVALIKGENVFGDALCTIQGFLISILARVSLQTMALVAVNRFFLILKPSLYRKIYKPCYTKAMILGAWILSGTEPLPYLAMGKQYYFNPAKVFCFPDTRLPYVLIVGYIYVGLPMPVLTWCYYKVFHSLRQHTRRLHHSQSTSFQSNPQKRGPSVEEINVTWTLFLTVCALIICWIPISVVDLMDFARGTLASHPRPVYMMYLFLGQLSTAVNPIIYGVMNKSFRGAYRKILCRRHNRIETAKATGVGSTQPSQIQGNMIEKCNASKWSILHVSIVTH